MSADLRTAAVAVLAVLAVAVAAATLGSTVAPEPQGLGGGAADGPGSAPAGGAPPAEEPPLGSPVPTEVVAALVLVALLAVLAYALRNRRVAVRALLVGGVVAALLVLLADLLPTPGRLPEPTAIGSGNGSAPPLGGSASAPVTPSSVLALAGLAVALLALLALLGRSGGDESEGAGGVGAGGADGDDAAAVGPNKVRRQTDKRPLARAPVVFRQRHQHFIVVIVYRGLDVAQRLSADLPADGVGRRALSVDPRPDVEEVPEDAPDGDDSGPNKGGGPHLRQQQEASNRAEDLHPRI